MKFQLTFSLDKPEIPTKDYRRIFASIIKNALSRYMDGQLLEKFYKDTKQKDFTWSVIFNKPEFSGEGIKLGKNEIKIYAGGETWITKNSLYKNTKNGLEKSK